MKQSEQELQTDLRDGSPAARRDFAQEAKHHSNAQSPISQVQAADGNSVPGGQHSQSEVFPTAIDAGNYQQAMHNFKYFIDNLPGYVTEKLTEHEEKTRKKIEKYLSGIEKFKADKEAHARKLNLIRQEFNNKFSLEENKQRNEMYLAEEQQITSDISEIMQQTEVAKITILQKKEIVAKYKEMVKGKAKRNIRLNALAEKLSYELEKVKKEAEAKKEPERSQINPKDYGNQSATFGAKNSPSQISLPILKQSSKLLPVGKADTKKQQTTQARKSAAEQHSESIKQEPEKQVETKNPKAQKLIQQNYRKLTRMFLRDMDIFNLFRDCLTSYFTYVRKTQEITQSDGLNGSMLFEIIHKSTQGKVGYPHLANTVKWDKVQTELQERHMISVVYESLKQEVQKKKRERALGKRKFNVSWEQLRGGKLCVLQD